MKLEIRLDGNIDSLEDFRKTTIGRYTYIFGWHGWRSSIVGDLWRGFEVEVFIIIPNELFDTPGKEPGLLVNSIFWEFIKIVIYSLGIDRNSEYFLSQPYSSLAVDRRWTRSVFFHYDFSNSQIQEFKGVFATIECRHKCEELTVE